MSRTTVMRLPSDQSHQFRVSVTDDRYDHAPVGLVTLDRQSRIGDLNETAARLLAFPRSWLLNRSFLVFVARHDVTRFVRWLIAGGRVAEQRVIHLDLLIRDYQIPVQISVLTTIAPTGEAMIHQLAISDLSDLTRVQRLTEESLAQVIRNTPDVVMTVARSGEILFVNRPLWGLNAETLLKKRVFDLVPRSQRRKVKQCLDRVFKGDSQSQCEIQRRNNGGKKWFTFAFGRTAAATNRRKTSTLLIREISDQKRIQEMLTTSMEQMRHFAAWIDLAREEERKRIAREIHDELGQALTILKLELSWVQSKLQKSHAVQPRMKMMVDHVDATIQKVRRISSQLRPAVLDDLGLSPAIEWEASEFQLRTGIETVVNSDELELELSNEASVAAFRVVQEALTNVIRHAQATKVQIDVRFSNGNLRISVADDGKGVTEKQVNSSTSFGIIGMKERISRLGGQLTIFSEPGKGARLDFTIPVQK